MKWGDFKTTTPELAEAGEKLFDRIGVVLIGTIRKDGSPRISPVEALIANDRLYIGMMPKTLKALDLLRDARCTIHSVPVDRMGSEGEFKAHGHAIDVQDAAERHLYCEELFKKMGWNPEGMDFHLFSFEIDSAGFFATENMEARLIKKWRVGEPVSQFRQYVDGRLERIS